VLSAPGARRRKALSQVTERLKSGKASTEKKIGAIGVSDYDRREKLSEALVAKGDQSLTNEKQSQRQNGHSAAKEKSMKTWGKTEKTTNHGPASRVGKSTTRLSQYGEGLRRVSARKANPTTKRLFSTWTTLEGQRQVYQRVRPAPESRAASCRAKSVTGAEISKNTSIVIKSKRDLSRIILRVYGRK